VLDSQIILSLLYIEKNCPRSYMMINECVI